MRLHVQNAGSVVSGKQRILLTQRALMKEPLDRSFGLIIAHVLPGFVCLAGASRLSHTVAGWMSSTPTADPTVGSFLYVALGSLGAGLICSAFRWALIDTLHHCTGLTAPELDFSKLQANIDAFQLAVEHNYRYYQFHASMALAVLFFAAIDQWTRAIWSLPALLALVILEFVLLMTSRDCLRRYYNRTRQLLASESQSLLELRSVRYFAVPRREASRDSYSATNSGSVVFRTRQNWRI